MINRETDKLCKNILKSNYLDICLKYLVTNSFKGNAIIYVPNPTLTTSIKLNIKSKKEVMTTRNRKIYKVVTVFS
jgi:hypothetical protein